MMQEALEAHDGASKGKYTIGLGQDCMSFCSDVEDVISMRFLSCLLAVYYVSSCHCFRIIIYEAPTQTPDTTLH